MTDDDADVDAADQRLDWVTDGSASGTVTVDDGTQTFEATDVSLEIDDTLADDAVEFRGDFEQADREISFSFDVEIDLEQTVVCRNCGEVNAVPDARFLTFLDEDPPCHDCGMPLGVIR